MPLNASWYWIIQSDHLSDVGGIPGMPEKARTCLPFIEEGVPTTPSAHTGNPHGPATVQPRPNCPRPEHSLHPDLVQLPARLSSSFELASALFWISSSYLIPLTTFWTMTRLSLGH
ncbi:hypothetical protein IGI04_036050, partial [Brassica rapa subsp. trilocularis]